MRIFLILSLLLVSICGKSVTYYVATTGDDDNDGSIELPWATWQKAFDAAIAGDTVYFRGGVWSPVSEPILNPDESHGNNGTYTNPICFFNYPGEVPILDCGNYTSEVSKVALDIKYVTYVKFRGLTVRNCDQIVLSQWISGFSMYEVGNIWLDQIVVHGVEGYGIWLAGFDTAYITNCDSYDNASLNDFEPGNRADGYMLASNTGTPDSSEYMLLEGCRAWYNSDDGFEISPSCQIDIRNNWSFINGREEYGAGVGYKFVHGIPKVPSKRKVENNISAFNKGVSFVEQNLNFPYGPVMEYSNNLSYRSKFGFGSDPGTTFDCALHYANVVYRNNLVYDSYWEYYTVFLDACGYFPNYAKASHNTWIFDEESPYWDDNDTTTVTDDDFVLLDSVASVAQLLAERKADGSLPDITFSRLVAGSDLQSAGVNVGMSSTPDIGIDWDYLDAQSGTENEPPVVTDIPNQSVTIGNSFSTITLDNYVSDVDNIDSQITWTYLGDTHINISITNRVATITYDAGFTGSETITFTATDPGSLTDSDQVTFTVNLAPTTGTVFLKDTSGNFLKSADGNYLKN